MLKSPGLYLIWGGKAAGKIATASLKKVERKQVRLLPAAVPAGSRPLRPLGGPRPRRTSPSARDLPRHVLPSPGRPPPPPHGAPASPPPLKMEVAAAGGWLRNARPPHGRADPKLGRAAASRRPGEAGPGRGGRAAPATHPQTGSPGSRSSGTWTAASWRPPQPRANHINRGGGGSCAAIGGGRAGAERHPGAGQAGAGRRGSLGSLLARPTARNRRAAPPPNTPT